LVKVEINMNTSVNGKERFAPRGLRPWHVLHYDYTVTRETLRLFRKGVCRTTEEGERQIGSSRESDNLIVSMKAGNAAGEKEVTHGSAL